MNLTLTTRGLQCSFQYVTFDGIFDLSSIIKVNTLALLSNISSSQGMLSVLGRTDPSEMTFEYVNGRYYMQELISISLMVGT